jgi:hypothetical protein
MESMRIQVQREIVLALILSFIKPEEESFSYNPQIAKAMPGNV